jgi:hypothetical protein
VRHLPVRPNGLGPRPGTYKLRAASFYRIDYKIVIAARNRTPAHLRERKDSAGSVAQHLRCPARGVAALGISIPNDHLKACSPSLGAEPEETTANDSASAVVEDTRTVVASGNCKAQP